MAKENMPRLKLLDDRLAVEVLEAQKETPGGIILPDNAREKPCRGRVVAAGPGRLTESAAAGHERLPMSVRVGDEVFFGRYAGAEVELDGKELKILREADILAVVG